MFKDLHLSVALFNFSIDANYRCARNMYVGNNEEIIHSKIYNDHWIGISCYTDLNKYDPNRKSSIGISSGMAAIVPIVVIFVIECNKPEIVLIYLYRCNMRGMVL